MTVRNQVSEHVRPGQLTPTGPRALHTQDLRDMPVRRTSRVKRPHCPRVVSEAVGRGASFLGSWPLREPALEADLLPPRFTDGETEMVPALPGPQSWLPGVPGATRACCQP